MSALLKKLLCDEDFALSNSFESRLLCVDISPRAAARTGGGFFPKSCKTERFAAFRKFRGFPFWENRRAAKSLGTHKIAHSTQKFTFGTREAAVSAAIARISARTKPPQYAPKLPSKRTNAADTRQSLRPWPRSFAKSAAPEFCKFQCFETPCFKENRFL